MITETTNTTPARRRAAQAAEWFTVFRRRDGFAELASAAGALSPSRDSGGWAEPSLLGMLPSFHLKAMITLQPSAPCGATPTHHGCSIRWVGRPRRGHKSISHPVSPHDLHPARPLLLSQNLFDVCRIELAKTGTRTRPCCSSDPSHHEVLGQEIGRRGVQHLGTRTDWVTGCGLVAVLISENTGDSVIVATEPVKPPRATVMAIQAPTAAASASSRQMVSPVSAHPGGATVRSLSRKTYEKLGFAPVQ